MFLCSLCQYQYLYFTQCHLALFEIVALLHHVILPDVKFHATHVQISSYYLEDSLNINRDDETLIKSDTSDYVYLNMT